jgi:hypothetical protein
MTTLRNLALTLIRRAGAAEIVAYRRHVAAHPAQALRLLMSKAGFRQ